MRISDWSSDVCSSDLKHLTPRLIAQRIMYCDAGSRADVDFIDDGLKMAVTWLPKGRTEILHAQRTGEEFPGDQSRAVVAGGSIASPQRGSIRAPTPHTGEHQDLNALPSTRAPLWPD